METKRQHSKDRQGARHSLSAFFWSFEIWRLYFKYKMMEESAVKVCIRVRPLISREESAALENAEPIQLLWKADKKSIHQIEDGNSSKSFSFDRVFTADETTMHLYQDIAKPLVVSTVEGYNGTIFAYGQTSSGKTFTMMGGNHMPGVIPLAVEDVFQTIKNYPKKEFLLRVSYMEIYNETVTDLLVDSWKRKPLEIRETTSKNIFVADLTEELVTSPAQAIAWIRKGEKNRHYGKTKMNQRSSRSHTIFRMILESRETSDPASGENTDGAILVSHLNLVDLAGSERASQTGSEGTRFKEGCNINRSLFTLGQVIKKLTDESQKGFTNYRDSKLTRILQNSLGGNAKTVIICTITPVTLDDTLSTLQFASTAKKMKNDPHLTEASDDEALLKRYRDEIVDLKRRLQEVSSFTQTTVTEKEVLSQLLQEKDQLQREQEDRIINLTKLLVTGSNISAVKKIPKRRVTWGGKMLRLARTSGCVSGSTDLSFAECFTHKKKADHSGWMELAEDDEDFDSHWEIPDEPSEMDTSRSTVAIRSFGDSPNESVSPDRLHEPSGKVSNLEMQLEMVSLQKEEAMKKLETLDGRMAELQLKLQTQAQQKQEDLEKIFSIEQRAADLELLLQTEAQQKLEAMERVEVFKLRVGDLERELKEQSNTLTNTNGQMRLEFAETVQLCETLASEKDMVIAERDYLQQELGIFIEQTKSLEKEKATLLQELEEKREMDEFRCLEEGFRKEYETELQNEILSLKKAIECSDLQCQEFQNKLKSMSAELKERTEFAEELQHMSGTDLLQEVATLRRSLDDAEGVSRDTKKEWALLRSQNIALEEINMTLTASHENMEGEVNTLRSQLETEKSRYRMMQSDLQKELNVVFDENTKLTALLEGKVPKNLIDSVELERTVASLNKELTASREAEGALRVQLEELASFQTLPKKVDTLIKQLEESEQHRVSLEEKLNEMQQLVKDLEEKLADSEVSKSTEEEISKELQEQLYQLTEELQCVRNEKEALLFQHNADVQSSVEEMEKLLSTLKSLTTERDQLRKDLQHNAEMAAETQLLLQSLQDELQDQIQKNSDLVKHSEQKKSDLAEQNADAQSLAEEVAKLLSTVASLTAERDQLKMDLQENVEMMIEIQEELRKALEKNWNQKEQIRQLEKAKTFRQDGFAIGMSAQLEALQTHVLTEELEHVRAERDSLSEGTVDKQTSTEEMEKLLSRMTSLSEERDQLQEVLEGLKQEKQQLREELEDRMETLQSEMKMLSEKLECVQAERDSLLSEKESICQTSTEEMEKLLSRMTSLSEERDQLQEVLEGLKREKELLREELEDRMEMILPIQEKLSKQDQFIVQQQSGRREEGVKLQHEFSSEANVAVSALRELSSSDNMTSVVKETLSSRLHDSAGKLEVFFRNFQHFMDTCSNSNSKALDETLRVEVFLSHYLLSLPKPIVEAYSSVFELGEQIFESLQGITMDLERHAAAYRIQFKELVKNDLAVFEERRLQDVLLCRVEAPSYSINDEDFCTLWHHRLTEVLDKRQLYLQKMASILEKLSAYIALFPSELSAEISERERFKAHLQALFKTQPVSISTLDNILNCELDRRSAVVHSRMMIRQSIAGELMKLLAELELLKGQTEAQLREERSKSHILLQALEEAPLTTELSLLKDNQQLVLQLQQVEEKATYLCVQKEQLEEAQVKANNRISDHEQAMQLLQTELQDSRTQVEEKENAIQTLKSKLQESEKNASPIAAKMENLQTKLFQMEVELYSVSDKHQQEIQRMTTLLTEKEDAMRKLREALRKSQQQGEESFLQGKDLHARLTNPRGLMIKSSIQMEKTKLEEEVKQLQLKIAELESLVSSQQAEIGKWKSRAFKLKVKSKAEVDKPLSPCTPTKRALPMTSDSSNFNSPKKLVVASKNPLDSPRKLLESPKVSLSDSPKSRLFDVDGSSDMLSRALPKQFFDNSSFLTIPGATGEEQWPQALKPEEICRTQ